MQLSNAISHCPGCSPRPQTSQFAFAQVPPLFQNGAGLVIVRAIRKKWKRDEKGWKLLKRTCRIMSERIFRQTLQYDRVWSSFLAKLWSSQASLFDSAITGSSRARRQCPKADFCIVVSKLADSNKTRGSVFQKGFCDAVSLQALDELDLEFWRLEVTQSGPGNWRSQTSTAQRGSEHAATAPSSSYGQQKR